MLSRTRVSSSSGFFISDPPIVEVFDFDAICLPHTTSVLHLDRRPVRAMPYVCYTGQALEHRSKDILILNSHNLLKLFLFLH